MNKYKIVFYGDEKDATIDAYDYVTSDRWINFYSYVKVEDECINVASFKTADIKSIKLIKK